jgi:hypothetical protein
MNRLPRKEKTRGTFWKDPCSPSVWGNADYTKALVLVKVTFLLNN